MTTMVIEEGTYTIAEVFVPDRLGERRDPVQLAEYAQSFTDAQGERLVGAHYPYRTDRGAGLELHGRGTRASQVAAIMVSQFPGAQSAEVTHPTGAPIKGPTRLIRHGR